MGKGNLHLAKPTPASLAARPKRTPVEERFLAHMVRLGGGKPLTVQEENLAIDQCLNLNGTLE